jgi:APA family basic amino acid/polyamine antiporter
MLTGAMPRSGGDYVYISRILSAPLGFGASIAFFLFGAAFAGGQNAWFTVSLALTPYLSAIGATSKNSGLISFASTLTQPLPSIAIGTVMVIMLFVFLLIPTSALHKVLFWLFVVGFIGYPILYVAALGASSHAQFVTAFNNYATANGYNTSFTGIINSAKSAGASIIAPTLGATIVAIPLAYATLGVPAPAIYVAGEIKRATRQVPLALFLGLAVIALSTAVMGYLTYNVFGYNFMSATGYYGFSGAPGYPLPSAPYPDYFLAILYPNLAFNIFMLISVVCWELIVMALVGLVATRVLFVWSFDRMVPSSLSELSSRFRTPVKAGVIVAIIAEVFLVATAYSFLTTYISLIIAQTGIFLFSMISAVTFPYLRKNIFATSPPFVKRRVGGIPLIAIFGLIGALALLVNFYFIFTDPVVSGFSVGSLIVVVVTYMLPGFCQKYQKIRECG